MGLSACRSFDRPDQRLERQYYDALNNCLDSWSRVKNAADMDCSHAYRLQTQCRVAINGSLDTVSGARIAI